ncbi:hypothetical protein LCGC14_2348650, partial [marine sediment metagenome]
PIASTKGIEALVDAFSFQTDGTIDMTITGISTMGNIQISGDRIYDDSNVINLGVLASTGHALGAGDVLIGGKLEIDGALSIDGITTINNRSLIVSNQSRQWGTAGEMVMRWDLNGVNDNIGILLFTESDGTNIPIQVISDTSFVPTGDAAFDDITEPSIGWVNDAATAFGRTYLADGGAWTVADDGTDTAQFAWDGSGSNTAFLLLDANGTMQRVLAAPNDSVSGGFRLLMIANQ